MIASRTPTDPKPSALVLGATGLVGGHVLTLLLASNRWGRVVTLGRRPIPLGARQHEHHVLDFEHVAERRELLACDDVFCCLGTTIAQAGSEAAFARVDRDYPLEAARIARAQGATQYLLVSSIGANPRSRLFYPRIKGEVEKALKEVGFDSLSIFRPSQLAGTREQERPKEVLALGFLRIVSPLLIGPLRRYRATPARAVAEAMVTVAAERPAGVQVFEAEEIVDRTRLS